MSSLFDLKKKALARGGRVHLHEGINGEIIGHFKFDIEDVQPGQIWAAADGSNHAVGVDAVKNGQVHYKWRDKNGEESLPHSKDYDSFHCRYVLVTQIFGISKVR